ncbi:HD domain-containing protein [bacterium]|nr:HD domain-containing protein [bacterium]
MKQRKNRWEPDHRASVRHRVAVEAARILYTREMKEYFQAKREAARRQGTVHLPSNREIHEQMLLLAHRLDGDGHEHRLQQMRLAALTLMEVLEPFHPRLIGSVLTGHIRKGSDIDLNVYSDDFDAVCAALGDYAVQVEVVRSRKNQENQEFTHLHVSGQTLGVEVEITVYPVSERHDHPRCGITGGPMRRASLAELRQLLRSDSSEPTPHFAWTSPASLDLMLDWVPELASCRGILQNNYHHLDVFDHTVEVVRGLECMVSAGYQRFGRWAESLRRPVDAPLLYLAGLCHDLGKPATQSYARDGRIRFWGHEKVGAEMARVVADRLGLSQAHTTELVALVDCHMEAVRIPAEQGEPSRIHALFRRLGPRVAELALLSLADMEAARGPAQSQLRREEHFRFVDFLLEQHFQQGFLAHPSLPVSPDDLSDQFGVTQPKLQRRILDWLTDHFVDGEFESSEEGLSLAGDFLSDPRNR